MTSLDVVYCSTKEEHIVDAAVSPHALEPAHGGLRHTPKRIVVFVAENTLSGMRLGLDVLLVLLGVVVALFALSTRKGNFNSHFRHLLFFCPSGL